MRFTVFFLLSVSIFTAQSTVAICLSSDRPFPECRYPAGDSWCEENGNGNVYAYHDECYRTKNAIVPPIRSSIVNENEAKASIAGGVTCSSLQRLYDKGRSTIRLQVLVSIGADNLPQEARKKEVTEMDVRLNHEALKREYDHAIARILSYKTITLSMFSELFEQLSYRAALDGISYAMKLPPSQRRAFAQAFADHDTEKLVQFLGQPDMLYTMHIAEAMKHFGLFDAMVECVRG